MANADGKLFNVDRWVIYTLQKRYTNKRNKWHYSQWSGAYLPPTPKQLRRMLKKMRKNQDYSIGITYSNSTNN